MGADMSSIRATPRPPSNDASIIVVSTFQHTEIIEPVVTGEVVNSEADGELSPATGVAGRAIRTDLRPAHDGVSERILRPDRQTMFPDMVSDTKAPASRPLGSRASYTPVSECVVLSLESPRDERGSVRG